MYDSKNETYQEMIVFSAAFGEKRHLVEAKAVSCGKSINITIGGGTHYHIGAAALAIPRPSLADPEKLSASASVICVTGHKEDELARSAALLLATSLGCIVNVSVGLHVDNASPGDISELIDNYNHVLKSLRDDLQEYLSR